MSENTNVNRDYIDAFSFKQDAIDTVMPKYFGDDTSDLNVGLKGYTTELVGHVAEDTFNTISILFTEQFPNRAQIPESIYSHAAIFQLTDTFATAAECKFLLVLVESEILKYAKQEPETSNENNGNIVVHIGGDTQITVEDVVFTIDYPIEINGRYYKNEYVYTADYMIDPNAKNSISNIQSPHLRVRKTVNGYIGIEVTAHQVVKTYQEERLVNNNTINYPIIRVKHDDQLAGMDVFYKAPKDTDWTLLEKKIIYSVPSKNPFCYYSRIDQNTVDIHFSTRDYFFQPEFNSQIKIVIYSTTGSAGNFPTYTGDNIAVIADQESYKYNSSMTMVAMVINAADGGQDVIGIDDLQALTVEAYSSATEISTDYDLQSYYYNFKHRYDDEILVLKRRDDASERLFSAFLLMKNGEYIYKTNTVKANFSESMFEYTNYELGDFNDDADVEDPSKLLIKYKDGPNKTCNTLIIKPGALFKYPSLETKDKVILIPDKQQTVYSLKENDVYDKIYYFCTGKNYFKENEYGTFDYYNGKTKTKVIDSNLIGISRDVIRDMVDIGYIKEQNGKYYDSTKLYWQLNEDDKFDLHDVDLSVRKWFENINFTTVIDFYEDACVKKDSLLDFIYSNPFLITITKNPNNVGYYLTMCNKLYGLDFIYARSDRSMPNFIVSQMRIRRDMYPSNIYTISTSLTCSLASITDNTEYEFSQESSLFDSDGNLTEEQNKANKNLVSNNNLRVIATMSVKGKEVCFIELFPVTKTSDMATKIELPGPSTLFVGHILTDDMILSDNRFRVLNNTVNNMSTLTEYAYIPVEDCIVNIYTLYKSPDGNALNKFADFDSTLTGYEITDIYRAETEPVTFIQPMNLMRSTMTMDIDDTDDVVFDLALVPLVKYNLLNDDEEFDKFLTNLTNQYDYLDRSIDVLRNNTGIDIKFYNTYGKSNNLFIGDDEELIDKVNISITFSVTAVYGTNDDVLLEKLRDFIKDYIEQINKNGRNHIYISNLMREVENNFAEVHHMKFIGINNYDSTYQSVYNKIVDINDLPKEERRNYVPEMLVVDPENINIAMYIDNTGEDTDRI